MPYLHTKLGEGDVTLLGDAAHAQLPALGLGVSTALGDIEELIAQGKVIEPLSDLYKVEVRELLVKLRGYSYLRSKWLSVAEIEVDGPLSNPNPNPDPSSNPNPHPNPITRRAPSGSLSRRARSRPRARA